MDLISSWTVRDYHSFRQLAAAQQKQVRDLADFFNDLSHLARTRYINDFYPIRLYFPSLMTCKEKLLPWWSPGLRNERKSGDDQDSSKYLYKNFEYLCEFAEDWKIKKWERLGYRTFLRSTGLKEL